MNLPRLRHVNFAVPIGLLSIAIGVGAAWAAADEFDGLGSSAGHIKSGTIKPLAVGGKERSPILPDVPTAAEAGLPNYEVYTWYALWAPAGTPQEIVDRLVAEVGTALESEKVKEVWTAQGAVPGALTPDAMGSFVSAEIARWGKVAKDANIRIE